MAYSINLILLILLLSSYNAKASVPADGMIATKCQATPQIENLSYEPDTFNLTNDLRKKAGSFSSAVGENIVLYGRIMDKNCVPIENAQISIWQANSYGLYQYGSPDSKNIDNRSKIQFDPNFLGSGMTNSDNMGRYSFLSILPGRFKESSSYINIKINHKDFKEFKTKIYFSNVIDNQSDKSLKEINPELRYRLIAITHDDSATNNDFSSDDQGLLGANNVNYLFDIILDEELPKKGY